jgi:hypothetical protein
MQVGTAHGQTLDASQWFARIGFTPAYVLPTNPFSFTEHPGDDPISWTPSMTIEVGRQTDGSQEWHHLYGLPSYGFGFSMASFGSGSARGRPLEAYTFFSWPFAQLNEQVQVATDFGMGVSWNWKQFNPRTETSDHVLGSNLNARINWGFYLRYLATPRTSLYAGVDFTHRSNGGTRQPDLGINVIGPSVALRYDLAPAQRAPRMRREHPAFQPAWELVVGAAAGPKTLMGGDPEFQHTFGAFDATAAVQRHFYRYGRVAVGTDVTYDGATGAVIDGPKMTWRPGVGQRLSLGFYGGYEHIVGRFGALVQVGRDVVRGFDDPNDSRWYQRYGWRYQVNDRVFGIFSIRATRGRKADFLEIGLGYKTPWP